MAVASCDGHDGRVAAADLQGWPGTEVLLNLREFIGL